MAYLDTTCMTLIAQDLAYPEGPVYCSDGSVLVVEIRGEKLTRCYAGNRKETVAAIPGGPNGAAIGPPCDGKEQIYICNDGGFNWLPYPPTDPWLWITGTQPTDYKGGSLQRVDLGTGAVETLYTQSEANPHWPTGKNVLPAPPGLPLKGPDDLVFDKDGGLWVSDFGKQRATDKDITGVFYRPPGGEALYTAIPGLNSPNGIALSPCGNWLYVALSFERRLLKYRIGDSGLLIPNPKTLDGSYLVSAAFPGSSVLDSMAVDAEGNIYVATMVPEGSDPMVNGGITVVSPDGKRCDYVELDLAGVAPELPAAPLPSNICFGGEDMCTAFITLGGTGHLISMPCEIPGLALTYNV